MKIVKYSNRKLYNTTSSGYITLEDVVSYVKTGTSFYVVEHKTGIDVTTDVLRAAVAEIALKMQGPSVLRELILSTNITIDTQEENNYTNALNA